MGAPAAVRGLYRFAVSNAFRQSKAGEDAAPQYGWSAPADKVKSILSHAGYTVTQLSASTGRLYGTQSPYFIPPTFLYKLRSGITPHICQVVALSETTGYRFVDWMHICGFDLRQIPRLQTRLHSERTVLITPVEFDHAGVWQPPAFRQAAHLPWDESWQNAGGGFDQGRYLLAKIGRRDALLHHQLMPGAIVRVDRRYRQRIGGPPLAAVQNLLWLVEVPGGLTCCHIQWIDDRQIILLPSRQPWGSLPLRLPTEARILGVVDTESGSPRQESVGPRAGPPNFRSAQSCGREKIKLPDLLRISRRRTGLTFRAARQLTVNIAQVLERRDYALGLGLLSDYEVSTKLPRHIAKIISLCITYCIDVRDLLHAADVSIDDAAKLPLPVLEQPVANAPDFLDSTEDYQTIGIGAGYGQPASGASKRFPESRLQRDLHPLILAKNSCEI